MTLELQELQMRIGTNYGPRPHHSKRKTSLGYLVFCSRRGSLPPIDLIEQQNRKSRPKQSPPSWLRAA
uniref:Uncharacterized protein n=1 Tax=Picea sitchensis TaxID=3332 RepID=A0A6B9XPE9_PICSI|nr:hypothetical protein Q903MT_gene3822 [Picea sitchensis]